MDDLQNAGVVVIAIVLILREVAAIIKARKEADKPSDASEKYNALFKIARESHALTQQLHECHLGPNALDVDGAPKWYNRAAMTEAVENIGAALIALNETLRDMHRDNKDIKNQLDRMEQAVK